MSDLYTEILNLRDERERLTGEIARLRAALAEATTEKEVYRSRWLSCVTPEEASRLRAENERLTGLVACLLYNEPDDSAADGVTVLEVWRKEAARALSKDLTNDK